MPKAPSANSASNASSRSALRRNQACRSCRKRKLKCDAARPHCGTCVKQYQALISVPAPVGYAHPPEPQCSYDPVEGLTLAPDTDPVEKIRQLEEQVASLKSKLYEQHNFNDSPRISSSGDSNHRAGSCSAGPSTPELLGNSAIGSALNLTQASLDVNRLVGSGSPDSLRNSLRGSPELLGEERDASDPYMQLLFSGWNPDLPEPSALNHYVDLFFKYDPCASRIFHEPSFLRALRLSPRDPGFPHAAILHAMCTSASRWSSNDVITLPDGTRRDQFAEFHAGKTRHYIDKTMANGQHIFPVMQACTILSWYFYQEGRWVEVWIFAGFQTRVAIPLRLNYPGTYSMPSVHSPGAYIAPPKDILELELRRRTWWMSIIFDRIASVGGWIHSIDEQSIGTELPLRYQDFEAELDVPGNPQKISDIESYTTHLPQYTDSFLIMLKAIMLFGKVTDYNVQVSLHGPSAGKDGDPWHANCFEALDKLVAEDFLDSLPPLYKQWGNEINNVGTLDVDLYMVHVIPHAAVITLHNPFLDFNNPSCLSTARCVNSARSILAAYYTLSSTSLDTSRLHPFVTICWYLAAVVQVQLCKYFIEIGDSDRESTVWGEINMLRFAMLEYGRRSPIGTRQEKLLQGLMREIVRLTAQKEPLEVGLPLYPFSHSGVFGGQGGSPSESGHSVDGYAPLPRSYDEHAHPGSTHPSPHIPGPSPHITGHSPHIPGPSPHIPGHSPHILGHSPHIPAHSPHIPGPSPHILAHSPHLSGLHLPRAPPTPGPSASGSSWSVPDMSMSTSSMHPGVSAVPVASYI